MDQIQYIRDTWSDSQRSRGTDGKRKHVKEGGKIDGLTASADRQKARLTGEEVWSPVIAPSELTRCTLSL